LNKFINSFEFGGHSYYYCDLKKVFDIYPSLKKLPNTLKILLELNIRNAKNEELNTIINTFVKKSKLNKISFMATRVIVKDTIGIPALVDLASLRESNKNKDVDLTKIKPQVMFDLVIENSFNKSEFNINKQKEQRRNKERFEFAKWAANNFENLSVIPPNDTNYEQVNLEYLSTMISAKNIDDKTYIFPETIIGADSYSTMINALGVLGYSAKSMEIESSILGSNIYLDIPDVIGIKVLGSLSQGVSINDVVLRVSNLLSEYDLEGKFIEFHGDSLRNISIEDRSLLSKHVSELGAVCAYFSIDENSISFVEQTRGVDATLIKDYYEKQELFNVTRELEYDFNLDFDLSQVRPVVVSSKKVQDKIAVEHIPSRLQSYRVGNFVKDNDIVLAEITSCISTSSLTQLIQAGLVAKKACELGLSINSNIRRVLSPDTLIAKQYLEKVDLLKYFEKLGFEILDLDCTSYCGNNDDLVQRVSLDIEKFNLNVSSITSENKEFEGRNHPLVKSNWLMSPALVVAYCLKGSMNFDITKESIIADIYLSDVWPSIVEVNECLEKINSSVFSHVYKDVFTGDQSWQDIKYEESVLYNWDKNSTYIQASNLFENSDLESINIVDGKILAILPDVITSEHLSPIGQVPPYSPAAVYLESKGLKPDEFNTFDKRRANSEVIARSTLSNIRLKNSMVHPKEGGYTKDFLTYEVLPIFEFASRMKEENRSLVVFAGNEFGKDDKTDWAAKGIKLLGVKAVIAKSFDENHRKSLVSMGVLPLEFIDDDIRSLFLKGDELVSIKTLNILPAEKVNVEIKKGDEIINITVLLRLDNSYELEYYRNGGVLPYLLKEIL